MQTSILLPTNEDELVSFYQLGIDIRNRHHYHDATWSDDHGLKQLLHDKTVVLKLITAEKDGSYGRLAIMHYEKETQGIIGWYECDENEAVSDELLNTASTELKKLGCTSIIGPLNGSTWNSYRFNTTSEKPLMLGEPYQPMYYVEFWKRYGFLETATYETTIAPKNMFEPMTMAEGQELANQYHLKVTNYPTEPSQEFKEKMYHFYLTCFKSNPLFKPIELKAYLKLFEKFNLILNAKHSLLVTDYEDNPIAVTLSYNDVYHELYKQGKTKDITHAFPRLFIKTIATHPLYQGKQIGTLMINLIHNLANETGYNEIYHMLMYRSNLSAMKGKEKFVTKAVREYGLFTLEL
jgi:GNAT superfamily N-acetyltransferase